MCGISRPVAGWGHADETARWGERRVPGDMRAAALIDDFAAHLRVTRSANFAKLLPSFLSFFLFFINTALGLDGIRTRVEYVSFRK